MAKNTVMSTQEVASHIVNHGGGTFFAYAGTTHVYGVPASADQAWVVAVDPGQDNITGKKHRNAKVALHVGDTDEVKWAVWEFLRDDYSEGSTFGAWVDGDYLYLDHVGVTDHATATKIAKERNELAIFNLATQKEERI